MHPAYSVIFFTTASGLGYGLLALLGLYAAAGLIPADRWFGITGMAVALGLITFGLLSSTFHLGHPERAWRAVTQWRSSWLSREGLVALATYVPAVLFAAGWVLFGRTTGWWGILGVLAAIGAALTVYCTGMIYASLRAIPRWHNRWVVPNYLALALATGGVSFDALTRVFGLERPESALVVSIVLAASWLLKVIYWRDIDAAAPVSTSGSATGLGNFGDVRLLDPPHTQDNYLQREMGYRIARKHAAKLRRIAVILTFALPLALSLLLLTLPSIPALVAASLSALSCMAGVVVERWLFFAEAKHVVTLYYGACEV
tara:strand:- start:2962 stop:3909 length:948 start_codon:yes stop_codon:yes gene_type:complete